MKKPCMWKNVEGIAKIKIHGVNLTLLTHLRGNKVKETGQIGNGRLRLDKTMLRRALYLKKET
jgi:hypothetical protein